MVLIMITLLQSPSLFSDIWNVDAWNSSGDNSTSGKKRHGCQHQHHKHQPRHHHLPLQQWTDNSCPREWRPPGGTSATTQG